MGKQQGDHVEQESTSGTDGRPRPRVARVTLLTFKMFKGSPVEGRENQKRQDKTLDTRLVCQDTRSGKTHTRKDLRKPFINY